MLAEAIAITTDSTIPLYVLIGACITGTTAAVGMFYQLREIRKSLKEQANSAWTIQDHTVWSSRLGQYNSTIRVPAVRKIQHGSEEE